MCSFNSTWSFSTSGLHSTLWVFIQDCTHLFSNFGIYYTLCISIQHFGPFVQHCVAFSTDILCSKTLPTSDYLYIFKVGFVLFFCTFVNWDLFPGDQQVLKYSNLLVWHQPHQVKVTAITFFTHTVSWEHQLKLLTCMHSQRVIRWCLSLNVQMPRYFLRNLQRK